MLEWEQYSRVCDYCKYALKDKNQHPCCECRVDEGYADRFEHATEERVEHPKHYNRGKIEVWDFVADQGLNFDRGSAIKYICRAGIKDPNTELEDLRKAMEFIQHEILTILNRKLEEK